MPDKIENKIRELEAELQDTIDKIAEAAIAGDDKLDTVIAEAKAKVEEIKAEIDDLQDQVENALDDAKSFFEKYKVLVLVAGGLVAAGLIAVLVLI